MQLIIRNWIINLTIIAILGALVDIILPNGSFRKYTSFIFGLIILVMIIQPLLQLFGQTHNITKNIIRDTLSIDLINVNHQANNFEDQQKQQLVDVFKRNLERTIASLLDRDMGLKNTDVTIAFNKNVTGMELSSISEMDIYTEEAHFTAVYIKPIDINISNKIKTSNQKVLEQNRVDEIKAYILEAYKVPIERIRIHNR